MALDHFHENSPETEEDNGRMSEELVDTMGRDNEVDEATSEDRDEDGAGDDSEGAREENKEERTEGTH